MKCVDFILGGHDHHYYINNNSDNLIVKSGSDFKAFTIIKIKSIKKLPKVVNREFLYD